MRHYTGKHGILEGFLREFIASGAPLPENPKHARRKAAKERARAEKQAQRSKNKTNLRQKQSNGAAGESEGGVTGQGEQTAEMGAEISLKSPGVNQQRRKRPSRNSTGSASSPESLMEEDEGAATSESQPHQPQLALVVKRWRPDGQSQLMILPFKDLIGSAPPVVSPGGTLLSPTSASAPSLPSTVSPAPTPSATSVSVAPSATCPAASVSSTQPLTCVTNLANSNSMSQLRALTSPTGEVILRQTNQEELIRQQLSQQQLIPQGQLSADVGTTAVEGTNAGDSSGGAIKIHLPQQPLPPEQVGQNQQQQQQQQQQPQQQLHVSGRFFCIYLFLQHTYNLFRLVSSRRLYDATAPAAAATNAVRCATNCGNDYPGGARSATATAVPSGRSTHGSGLRDSWRRGGASAHHQHHRTVRRADRRRPANNRRDSSRRSVQKDYFKMHVQ